MKFKNINEQKRLCVEDLLAKKNSHFLSQHELISNASVQQVEKYLLQLPAPPEPKLVAFNTGQLLTTQEACKFLRCSKTTLLSYKKAGILRPWQPFPRGLTRWPIEDLKKLNGCN